MQAMVVMNQLQEHSRCRPVDAPDLLRYRLPTEVTRKPTSVRNGLASGLLLILSLAMSGLAEAGGKYGSEVASAPHLQLRPLHASGLHLGMEAEELLRIMGEGAQRSTFREGDIQVYSFPAEPIPTKVVVERNKVTSVSLDVARLDDAHLPVFSRRALVGMSSQDVRDLLGAPTELRHHELAGTKLDQLIFARPNEPVTSLFFVDDRLITKTLGATIPTDIFGVIVPAAPDPSARRTGMDGAVIGASTKDMQSLFGKPDLVVEYSFNRQRAMHAIYHTPDHHTLSVYFVGDALTEITDVGTWSMQDVSSG